MCQCPNFSKSFFCDFGIGPGQKQYTNNNYKKKKKLIKILTIIIIKI